MGHLNSCVFVYQNKVSWKASKQQLNDRIYLTCSIKKTLLKVGATQVILTFKWDSNSVTRNNEFNYLYRKLKRQICIVKPTGKLIKQTIMYKTTHAPTKLFTCSPLSLTIIYSLLLKHLQCFCFWNNHNSLEKQNSPKKLWKANRMSPSAILLQNHNCIDVYLSIIVFLLMNFVNALCNETTWKFFSASRRTHPINFTLRYRLTEFCASANCHRTQKRSFP